MTQKKKILLIVALIIVLSAVLVALLVGGKDNKDSDKKSTESSQNKNEPDSTLLGEQFTTANAGVSMRVPKGWELAPKNDKNPGSLTRFVWTEGSTTSGQANGELLAIKSRAPIDDIVRIYLEAAMDISATPDLIANQDVRIGDRTVRLLSQEIPGPNGVKGRITQYIIYNKDTYYILAYTMISSDFESQKPAIEESVKSLKFAQ